MSDNKDNIPPYLDIPHPADDHSSVENAQVFNRSADDYDVVPEYIKANVQSDTLDAIVPEKLDAPKAKKFKPRSDYADVFEKKNMFSKVKFKTLGLKNKLNVLKTNKTVMQNMPALLTTVKFNVKSPLKKVNSHLKKFTEIKKKSQTHKNNVYMSLLHKKIISFYITAKHWCVNIMLLCVKVILSCINALFLYIKNKWHVSLMAKNGLSCKSGAGILALGLVLVIGLHSSMNIPNYILPLKPISSVGTSDDIASSIIPVQADNQFDNSMFSTPYRVSSIIEKGKTLGSILNAVGIANNNRRNEMFRSMRKIFNPRNVRVGQKIILDITGGYSKYIPAQVDTMEIIVDAEKSVLVQWDKNTYVAIMHSYPLKKLEKNADGVIKNSVYMAMKKQGIKRGAIVEFINLFSFDVDFQRDVRKNDSFDIVYNEYNSSDGGFVRSGDIRVAELSIQGNRRRYYRYKNSNGKVGYYDHSGKSGRKALMKTPIEGARLSSSFGRRKHPILGYTKHHNGTDFAAPKGTPIFAAGDGVVEYAGRKGVNGIYVRIRHNGTYKTAYAHMSGIARGVRRGKRVVQGKVIGYVGTTGRSTGNHLHYSVYRDGKAINSRRMKLPSGVKLKGKALSEFKTMVKPLMKDGL